MLLGCFRYHFRAWCHGYLHTPPSASLMMEKAEVWGKAKDTRQKAQGRRYCHEIPRCNVAAQSDMMIVRKTVEIFVVVSRVYDASLL
jgi:hypothetical protein